jgi:hypothetical protein
LITSFPFNEAIEVCRSDEPGKYFGKIVITAVAAGRFSRLPSAR